MTTATRSVAVVATRLPITDRRALSQAWYSALHLTPASTAGAVARPAAAATFGRAAAHRIAPAPARSSATPAPMSSARGQQPALTVALPERRGPATELSRRIERALVHHVAQVSARPTTLTIKAGDGRVQLLVRGDGTTTRVVALCAPDVRDRVDRALARARFALAASGTRIEVTAQ